MPEKVTQARIKTLTDEGKPTIVRDAKVTGRLVAVNKTGKSYKVQRDLWQGQRGRKVLVMTVRHTLGGTEEMTLDDARSKATAILDLIKRGIDPNAPPPEPGHLVPDMHQIAFARPAVDGVDDINNPVPGTDDA